MKKTMLLLTLAGCGLVSFDVTQAIPEQVIQGSPLGGLLPVGLFQIPMQIDIEQSTKARGTGPASAAYLRSVTLAITAPAGATFDFVDTMTVKISAPGLPEREVAKLPARQSKPRLELDIVPGIDLLPYMQAGATMSASATGHQPSQDTRYDGQVVVKVKV